MSQTTTKPSPDTTTNRPANPAADDRLREVPPEATTDARGLTDLIKDLRDESMHLLRQEVNLAKTEMQEKVHFFTDQSVKIAIGLGVLTVGALGLLSAAAFLLGALIDQFVDNLNASAANGLGFLIVGALAALIGYVMYSSARSKLAKEPVTPERTIQSLKDDKQWLTNKSKETAHDLKTQVTG